MGKNVFANNMEIAAQAADGKVVAAFPDVCMSPPPPPAGPIPIPYPDSSFAKDAKEGSKSVKIGGQPVMLKDQSYYQSSPLGDEASTKSFGANLVSHVNSGKTYFAAYSMDVKAEGKNVCRAMDLTTSNHASPPPGNGIPTPNLGPVAATAPPDGKFPERERKKEKTWIKYRVVDDVTHKPVPNVKLLVTLPDDSQVDALTNGDGQVEFQGIDPGAAYVTSGYKSAKADSSLIFVGWGVPKGEPMKYEDPDDPAPYQIVGATHEQVKDDTSIKSFADSIGISWQQLAKFNWNTADPKQINKKLVEVVGCTKMTADRQNYMFRTYDKENGKGTDSGMIWLPLEWSRVGKGTARTHTIRVRRPSVPAPVKPCTILEVKAECSHQPEPLKKGEQKKPRIATAWTGRTQWHYTPGSEILEVVPDTRGGADKIELTSEMSGPCEKHPEWEIEAEGKGMTVTNAPSVTLNAEALDFDAWELWIPEAKPRRYKVALASCHQVKRLEIHAYPVAEKDFTLNLNWMFAQLQKLAKIVEEQLKKLNQKLEKWCLELKVDLLKMKGSVEAGWKEFVDHRAFFAYKIALKFDPLIGIELKFSIGTKQLSRKLPEGRLRKILEMVVSGGFYGRLALAFPVEVFLERKSPDEPLALSGSQPKTVLSFAVGGEFALLDLGKLLEETEDGEPWKELAKKWAKKAQERFDSKSLMSTYVEIGGDLSLSPGYFVEPEGFGLDLKLDFSGWKVSYRYEALGVAEFGGSYRLSPEKPLWDERLWIYRRGEDK